LNLHKNRNLFLTFLVSFVSNNNNFHAPKNMTNPIQLTIFPDLRQNPNITVRNLNILRSPKQNGKASFDSKFYLDELGIGIIEKKQPIQFNKNNNELIHRWSPYVQGFSASFVQSVFDEYKNEYDQPVIFDPFAGSGTVLIQSKLNNLESYGVELNPLLHFIGNTKLSSWQIDPDSFMKIAGSLKEGKKRFDAPDFLHSKSHFSPDVLHNLEMIKSQIDGFIPQNSDDILVKDLLLVAFSSILIDCSNLKRSPCLGYCKRKIVNKDAPFASFKQKINEIYHDLLILQKGSYKSNLQTTLFLADSKLFTHENNYDLVITSPPYMNGLDYVMNYKIEMGWLGFAENHKQLKKVKDQMVVCDNVSKGLIRNFTEIKSKYSNPWIDNITTKINQNIVKRGSYRRLDMPEIVQKYFDDMYQIMKNTIEHIKPKGRLIMVIGDSLIADEYVPTDLITAKMGLDLGLKIEKIEKARNRRSGQIRSYQLRETIVTLKKS